MSTLIYDGPNQSVTPREFDHLLKSLSRSFYLSLRVLPSGSRQVLSLGYLLARAADTIADTHVMRQAERAKWLVMLKDCIIGQADCSAINFLSHTFSDQCALQDEKNLLMALPQILPLLENLHPDDLQDLRQVLGALVHGMCIDLERFSETQKITALQNEHELDTYCHFAAGVVGPFWTQVIHRHDARLRKIMSVDSMGDLGEKFGRGLQLVNVLKDVAQDLAMGRCYIPLELLKDANLSPQDLLDPKNIEKFRPVLHSLTQKSLDLLSSGQVYIDNLPRWAITLRLAVIWPLWIGLATLRFLQNDLQLLNPNVPHKIPRRATRWLILKSLCIILFCPGSLDKSLRIQQMQKE